MSGSFSPNGPAPNASYLEQSFNISLRGADARSMVLVATSLEVAPRLVLSIAPWRVRDLKDSEIEATMRLFGHNGRYGRPTREAISRSVYIGRIVQDKRALEKQQDSDTCLYLLFPLLETADDEAVEQFLHSVIIPSFTTALEESGPPPQYMRNPPGPPVAAPSFDRHQAHLTDRQWREYPVISQTFEEWEQGVEEPEELPAARSRIHKLAWENIVRKVQTEQGLEQFKGMVLLAVVPDMLHQVTAVECDVNPVSIETLRVESLFREALSFYDMNLDPQFLEDGKGYVALEYDMKKVQRLAHPDFMKMEH
ncbi:hypothetical protein P154DRAFT_562117 [Amniculicola lignicola CBS 123094]|uniref:Uncharacterized protein n=1 Tax=Amniculicola lignicola CBS 123094 TaxID=1392246 RepID=A0A6A5WN70_9PLEO|nr:hypothetical protein P154DRAFT_562117 [Amniculicola lignicola CBS 123094]